MAEVRQPLDLGRHRGEQYRRSVSGVVAGDRRGTEGLELTNEGFAV
jgi:hypothetical protein